MMRGLKKSSDPRAHLFRLSFVSILFFAVGLYLAGMMSPNQPRLAHAQSTTGKPFSALSLASNNATLVYGDRALGKALHVINTTATTYFLKLYDKKTVPVCGTDTPMWRVPLPPQNTGGGVVAVSMEDLAFFSGLGFCLVANIADNDNTNAATGIAINLSYFPQ